MNKLIVLKGLPASGKTTYAKELAKKDKKTVIINRDKIREMLKGEYSLFPFQTSMEELVTDIEKYSMEMALEYNYTVVMDNTNFRWNLSERYVRDVYNAELEIVDFTHVSLEECIERDSWRQSPIGKEIIERMYNKYIKK